MENINIALIILCSLIVINCCGNNEYYSNGDCAGESGERRAGCCQSKPDDPGCNQ